MNFEKETRECQGNNKTCAFCGTPLVDENTSKEHVFPNAIGGHKIVRNFLCVNCNSETGTDWDSALVKQLLPLCTMLNITRKRGENQPFDVETISGKKISINPDGTMTISKPVFEEQNLDNKTHIKIQARNIQELNKMLPGLMRKYPQLNIDALKKHVGHKKEYCSEPYELPLNFGGEQAGRSIIKSCLSMVYDSGLDISQCDEAKRYLLNEGEPCFGYYSERDFVQNRPQNVFFHCVYVCGDPEKKQILAYVEYFGFLRIVACLSKNYDGKAFSNCYAIDPVSKEELDLEIELTVEPTEISDIYAYRKVNYQETNLAIAALLEYWINLEKERACDIAIYDALNFACEECGVQEGDILSDEQIAQFTHVLVNRLTPFLEHMLFGSNISEKELREIALKSKNESSNGDSF